MASSSEARSSTMDKQHVGGGVKVTYIETRFVTSDAAGFKDLVQRLTGRSPAGEKPSPAAAPHRPRACRAASGGGGTTAAAAGARAPQGYDNYRPVAEVCFPAARRRARRSCCSAWTTSPTCSTSVPAISGVMGSVAVTAIFPTFDRPS
ncbi:hypothetical protein C2845_PM12G08470 [Panicum miliaceum]|uniref:VQ domain-containing protein n=1 Tax=Panicum miliaceum TaxID=4540 RepID=A0A3L6QEU2_PANMI|nr:hypothetical protein C2845_PM12G08470 [Panicum miliaceum]